MLTTVVTAHKPDVVCWLAAFHAYGVGENPFIRVSWLNYTLNTILPIMALVHTRFILFSSESVYIPQPDLITEMAPVKWGALKTETQGQLIAEWYTHSVCNYHKIPWQILRLSNLVGERKFYHPVVDRLSFIIDNLITANENLIITNPAQLRDYLYIKDAVGMIYKVIRKGQDSQIYNISSGFCVSNNELLELLNQEMTLGNLPKVVDYKEASIVLSNRKALGDSKAKLTPLTKILPSIINFRKGLLGGEISGIGV
jgi:nucleoside-diphosphate-sugar epimerase